MDDEVYSGITEKLGVILDDLKDLMRKDAEQVDLSGVDSEEVKKLAEELASKNDVSVLIGGKKVLIPKPSESITPNMILTSESLNQLTPEEVDEFFIDRSSNAGGTTHHDKSDFVRSFEGTACTPSDVIFMEAAAEIYRMRYDKRPCCFLDSPSCVLVNFTLLDKLDQLDAEEYFLEGENRYHPSYRVSTENDTRKHTPDDWNEPRGSQSHNSCNVRTPGFPSIRRSSKEAFPVGDGRTFHDPSIDAFQHDGNEQNGGELFGADTWLTAPIAKHFPRQEAEIDWEATVKQENSWHNSTTVDYKPDIGTSASATCNSDLEMSFQAGSSQGSCFHAEFNSWSIQEDDVAIREEFSFLHLLRGEENPDGMMDSSESMDINGHLPFLDDI